MSCNFFCISTDNPCWFLVGVIMCEYLSTNPFYSWSVKWSSRLVLQNVHCITDFYLKCSQSNLLAINECFSSCLINNDGMRLSKKVHIFKYNFIHKKLHLTQTKLIWFLILFITRGLEINSTGRPEKFSITVQKGWGNLLNTLEQDLIGAFPQNALSST